MEDLFWAGFITRYFILHYLFDDCDGPNGIGVGIGVGAVISRRRKDILYIISLRGTW